MSIDRHTFAQQRERRFGSANPSRMDCDFWLHMVRTGRSAHLARQEFDLGGDACEGGPVWCFHRFGPTRTLLPDGTVICIGGEHEDSYDPDFCIYNDVIAVRPDRSVEIYGYPKEVFPPTDFHTATLCDGRILIVGGLGYFDERGGEQTPVYSLDLATLAITRVPTSGPSPGWIYGHRAQAADDGQTLRIWGGKAIKGRGKGESLVRCEGAVDLALADMAWRPAAVPVDPDVPPAIKWPWWWSPIRKQSQTSILSTLLLEVPLGHPLFPANVWPVAQCEEGPSFGKTLFRLLDGTGRVAVVDLDTGLTRHAEFPAPATFFYDSLDAWMTHTWQHEGSAGG